MNRRGFFGWLTAATAWMVGWKASGNCFVGYGPDMSKPPLGRYSTKEQAFSANALCVVEFPSTAWAATDLSSIGAIAAYFPASKPRWSMLCGTHLEGTSCH